MAAVATALLQSALASIEHITAKEEWEASNQPGPMNDTVGTHASRTALDCLIAAIFANGLGTCHYVHATEESDERVFSRSMPTFEGPRAFSCGLKDSLKRVTPLIGENDRHHFVLALSVVESSPVTALSDTLSESVPRFEERDTVRDFFAVTKVEVPAEEVAEGVAGE